MDSLLTNQTNHQNMSTSLSKKALFLSFASGFLSLSLEVIYIRLFGFYSGGLPQVFAFTLALFLLAIALGALYGKDICSKSRGGGATYYNNR